MDYEEKMGLIIFGMALLLMSSCYCSYYEDASFLLLLPSV